MRWQRFAAILTLALTIALLTLTLVSSVWAAEYKVLYRFQGGTDGQHPSSDLIFDGAGNLYGTTDQGGAYDYGVAFKLTPNPDGSWTETVLYSFTGYDGSDPTGSLIFDAAGNLYGTTQWGGAYWGGTVFKLTPNPDGSWSESVIYSFSGRDGYYPSSGVIFDSAGNLYGTTQSGGTNLDGNVFKLTPNPDGSWSESVIYSFGGPDGYDPDSRPIFDAAGNLYGTTTIGGPGGGGIVFKLTPNPDGSWSEHVIYSFSGPDGYYPRAGLIFDSAGNLYGATTIGGAGGEGTVFKLTPNPDGSWTRTKLHAFKGPDGANPYAGLILGTAGDLYGTTYNGGYYGEGTVFKLSPNPDGRWARTKLHRFQKHHHSSARLVMDAAGNLYGTTPYGGGHGSGVVFKITP